VDEKELLNTPALVLAIDPGLSGAVCRLGQGKLEILRDFKIKTDIARAIKTLSAGVSHAIIEFVHAMPGQGVCSMFSFGRSAGVADGALSLALPEVQPEEVSPQKWQGFFRAQFGILKGTEFDSRAIASKIFPSFAPYFKRVKDHNSGDAVLMAVWKAVQLQARGLGPPR
jgi:crossover junction endodeoxyribonuclease RuvC